MATIVGALASPRTATIGLALDVYKESDPNWAQIFKGYEPVRQWLATKKPDVLFFIFNDHMTSFFFEHFSHFALGVGDSYPVADDGGACRLPPIKGNPKFAAHIAAGLAADEFDLSFFQGKGLDHGCFSPLSVLWPHEPEWPGAIVPLQVGVLLTPAPTVRRCYKLGKSLRKAILSYPENLKVAIVAAGGLSHQVHGEHAGFNNTEWELKFMELLETDPQSLPNITAAEYARSEGWEGEIIMG